MNAPTPPSAPHEGTPSSFNDSGPATQTPGSEEQSSQHGKRAVIVAAVLGALVVGGLLVDSLRTPSKAQAAAQDTARAPVPQDPFVDFEAKQKMEAARLDSERQKKLAEEKAEKARRDAARAEGLRDTATTGTAAAPATRNLEDEAREKARIDDLTHALAAVRSHEMVVATARDRAGGDAKSAPAGAGTASLRNVADSDSAKGAGDSTLARLRQAIDRVRGGANASGTAGADGVRFVRDLRGPEASAAVVGQSASSRRERGEPQRPGEYRSRWAPCSRPCSTWRSTPTGRAAGAAWSRATSTTCRRK